MLLIGKPSIDGPFSMAMLNNQRVLIFGEENPLESIYQSSMIRRSTCCRRMRRSNSSRPRFTDSLVVPFSGKAGSSWGYDGHIEMWKYTGNIVF